MVIKVPAALAAAAVALAVSPAAGAQVTAAAPASAPPPGPEQARTVFELIPAKARLKVTSPAFREGGDIAFENTQYRGNTFPGLTWSKGPTGTVSYVVILQDSSMNVRGGPVLHWVLFNVPPRVTSLPRGMTPEAKPAGSSYGPNYKGVGQPYLGPRTPPGPKHTYHFQVFALDATVPDAASSDFAALTAAMQGHVLASGQTIGLGQADPNAPPRR